jgi:hypothetical protein
MIELITLGTSAFIGGAIGGTCAALLIDKLELVKLSNLSKRITRLEGYYGAEVSKDNRAEAGDFENQAIAAAMNVLADKSLTAEDKQAKLLEMGKIVAAQRPDLIKKLGGKYLEGLF